MFYVAHTYEAAYSIECFTPHRNFPIEMLKLKVEVTYHACILYAGQTLYGVAYYIIMFNVAQEFMRQPSISRSIL